MSGTTVFLTYGFATLLALTLLFFFRARRWYWHVASVLLATFIGVVPPPAGWAGQRYDLAVGFVFFFLCLWGFGGMFFRHRRHGEPHEHSHAH